MGEYVPLYISVCLIIIVGVFAPLLGTAFGLPQDVENSFVTPIINLVTNGLTIPLLGNINPFGWFGETFHNGFLAYLSGFAYLPNWFNMIIGIIIMLGFAYGLIKLLPTT